MKQPTDEGQQDQCNITLEEGQELLGAIRAHIATMAKKTLEALEMTLYDANGEPVVFELGDDCHAHLPAEGGQAEIDFGVE